MSGEAESKPADEISGVQDDNQGLSEPEQVSLSRAELEKYKADAARYRKIQEDAESFGKESVEDYLDELIINRFAGDYQMTESQATTPAPQSAGNAEAGTQPHAEQAAHAVPQAQSRPPQDNLAAQAVLQSQWVEFQLLERDKPDDERSPAKKDDLMKMLQNPALQGQIGATAMSPEFGGNLFAAAAHIRDLPKMKERYIELGRRQALAGASAQFGAEFPGGGGRPPTAGQDTVAAKQKEILDMMFPDDPPVA